MVFSNLQHNEKEAFFALLDEYFTSRPEILASIANSSPNSGLNNASTSATVGAAASVVQRAFTSHPQAASKFVSAGLRHATASTSHNQTPSTSNQHEHEEEPKTSVASKIAAFSAARSSGSFLPASRSGGPPPIADKPSAFSSGGGFASSRNALASIYGGIKSDSTPSPPAPTASFGTKSSFAPPPLRRGASDTPVASQLALPPAPPPPRAKQQEEEETRGEWAEALYDYDSQEPADLNIRENQRILVTEKNSDDWWTGEFEGKTGLFPATYVKLL